MKKLDLWNSFIKFEDKEGAPFWSGEDQLVASRCQNEGELVLFITPFFVKILKECGMVFVNSEVYKWLSQGPNYSKSTDLKPDGFATHLGMYAHKESPNDTHTKSNSRDSSFLFGVPVPELQDSIILFEGKVKTLGNAALGEVVRYFQCLGISSSAVLFSAKSFWLITFSDKKVTQVIAADWVQSGSKVQFTKFIQEMKPLWVRLLEDACKTLDLEIVDANSFLGRGATGRVFRVKLKDGTFAALKIVLGDYKTQLIVESQQLERVQESKRNSSEICVKALGKVQELCGDKGFALLISPVGKTISRELLKERDFVVSLYELLWTLHFDYFFHGDPRIENIILAENRLLWIDFMGMYDFGQSLNLKFRMDAELLTRSILLIRTAEEIPDDIEQKIEEYANLVSKNCMIELAHAVFEKIGLISQ